MLVAAALCPAPPLLARELTGAALVVPDLRRACQDAVAGILSRAPSVVVIVGVADDTRRWDPATRLDLGVFAPQLAARAQPAGDLPTSVGLGSMLLDQAGHRGPRELQSVAERESPEACAALGEGLAAAADRVALLVMADGSARRTLRAPGYLDARSAPFDEEVHRAVRQADLEALLAIDPLLAHELMATGRPCWQVLAGAARGPQSACQVRYCDDPFGVSYLVASVDIAGQPAEPR